MCDGRNKSRSELNTNSEEGSLCSFGECESEDVNHLDSEDVSCVRRSLDITCSVPALTEGVCVRVCVVVWTDSLPVLSGYMV